MAALGIDMTDRNAPKTWADATPAFRNTPPEIAEAMQKACNLWHKYYGAVDDLIAAGKYAELKELEVAAIAADNNVHLLYHQYYCNPNHISTHGGMHYENGEVWDDIHDVCDDCGRDMLDLAVSTPVAELDEIPF
jgi:hypothetical protein